MDPSDIPLPAFLDPLLDYLSDNLPPPVYSFLILFLSYSLALLTALISLVSSLIASKPWEWDAQTIIPPLIGFLAAYLALVSLYRTTSWMLRTTFWFIKWGTILGALTAGAGWYMGNQNAGGGGRGLVANLGGVIFSMLNGEGQNTAARRSQSNTAPRSSSQGTRPKPWESFDKHQEWQYQERNEGGEARNEAQRIMSDIMTAANRILVDGGWLDAAKSAFAGGHAEERKEAGSGDQQGEKKRAKSR
ncbi:hypothetical protein HYDPIDRAFT_107360 [Hydnomerulius pinastri MD-312]|nr:hypothetical protein HYDPIDRAFT_107360 [Hydnomerulius pinastri MD-312]